MTLVQLHSRVQGWVAHAAHGNTWGLRRALFSAPIPVGARSQAA